MSETDHYNELLYNSEFQLRVRDPEGPFNFELSAYYVEIDPKTIPVDPC